MTDTFVLTINTESPAFEGDGVSELSRIIRVAGDQVTEGKREGVLRDSQGHACGLFGFEPRRSESSPPS